MTALGAFACFAALSPHPNPPPRAAEGMGAGRVGEGRAAGP